jgi:trimethylamine--corrinoid protein Co-methyltransferase
MHSMNSIHNEFQTPRLHVLSETKINKLYQAALECLERTGVDVPNKEAQELLADAGADVDGSRIRIARSIIETALRTAPQSFSIYGRNEAYQIKIEPENTLFGPGPTCTYFIDPETGERRKTRKGDPALTARVCDALENIDYAMSLGMISDANASMAPVIEFAEMITHTTKPVLAWGFSLDNLKDIYEIALAFKKGEKEFRQYPNFGFFSTWQSPLKHIDENLESCLWAVERGIPVIYSGGGVAGLSAPVTGAGVIATDLASMLSGLAIFQLKKPGAPVCVGGIPAPMDLQTARLAYGGPEMSLYSAALSEVVQYLSLPFMGAAGASESKVMDLQAAIESTIQITLSSLGSTNLIHDIGFLDCADIGSLEMLVMNDTIIKMVKRIMQGIEVNEDTLMLDQIDTVGPGGEFLSSVETVQRCRQELFYDALIDRDPWTVWQENEALTMLDRIKNRLKEIVTHHKPVAITENTRNKISHVLNTAGYSDLK